MNDAVLVVPREIVAEAAVVTNGCGARNDIEVDLAAGVEPEIHRAGWGRVLIISVIPDLIRPENVVRRRAHRVLDDERG